MTHDGAGPPPLEQGQRCRLAYVTVRNLCTVRWRSWLVWTRARPGGGCDEWAAELTPRDPAWLTQPTMN